MADRTRVPRSRAHGRSSWRSEAFQSGLWGLEQLESRLLLAAPVAVNDSYTVPSGQYVSESVSVLANDTSSDPTHLTASVTTGAQHGSVMMSSDGTFYYASTTGYTGTDSFTYTARDSNGSSTATVTLDVIQPAISLSVTYGASKSVTVSGTVTDAVVSGVTVTFSGVLSGTTSTDSGGKFSFTGTPSALGTITATFTSHFGGNDSSSVTISDPGPTISDFTCENVGGEWELSGTVSDPWGVAGLIVTFGGPADGYTATADSDGDFSVILSFKPTGEVTATTEDVWGVSSNVESITVS